MSTRETPFDNSIAAIVPVEEAVLGAFLISDKPRLLAIELGLEADDFVSWPNRVVYQTIAQLLETNKPIDPVTIEHAITLAGRGNAVGMARLGELVIRGCRDDEAVHYVKEIKQASRNRKAILAMAEALDRAKRWPHEADELLSETRGELQRLEEERSTKRTYHTVFDIADAIREFARRPWVTYEIGGEPIDALPLGESLCLAGPTGGGKSTLAFAIATSHAKKYGPALIVSKELSEVAAASRIAAMESGASWSDVLRGHATEYAIEKLCEIPRLVFLDLDRATLATVQKSIHELKLDYPGEPIMVVIDYIQLFRLEGSDMRARVADAIDLLRKMIQRSLVAGLLLSQMAREKSNAARKAERLGADTTDGGAESGAIEQAAATTAELGYQSDVAQDGSRDVLLSIGKARYGGGDRVIELRQWGATGVTRVLRDQPASQVREARERQREEAKAKQAESKAAADMQRLVDAAQASPRALTRSELASAVGMRSQSAGRLIAALIANHALVEVHAAKSKHATYPPVWTPARQAEGEKA